MNCYELNHTAKLTAILLLLQTVIHIIMFSVNSYRMDLRVEQLHRIEYLLEDIRYNGESVEEEGEEESEEGEEEEAEEEEGEEDEEEEDEEEEGEGVKDEEAKNVEAEDAEVSEVSEVSEAKKDQ